MNEIVNVTVAGGTPGADSNDYVLFSTLTAWPGGQGFSQHDINRVTFTVVNDHTGTLKAYYSQNKGVTFTLYSSTSVGIPASGAISGPYDFPVDAFPDWKLVWTNGGSAQGTWLPAMSLIRGQRAQAAVT